MPGKPLAPQAGWQQQEFSPLRRLFSCKSDTLLETPHTSNIPADSWGAENNWKKMPKRYNV